MGRRGVGEPSGRSVQRREAYAEFERARDDPGSPRIVRGPVDPVSVSGGFERRKPLPVVGHRQGKLEVTGFFLSRRGGVYGVVVQCGCGRPEHMVDCYNFQNAKSTRCPDCGRDAGRKKRFWKHALAMPDDEHRRRLLNRLAAATTRCHSPSARQYSDYGGRGIYVHDLWRRDKAEFLRYVQTLEGWDIPEREMDRTDNDKGYVPGNIRFVPRETNAANRRRVAELQKEITRLRSALMRAQASLRCPKCRGAIGSS